MKEKELINIASAEDIILNKDKKIEKNILKHVTHESSNKWVKQIEDLRNAA